MSPAAIKGIERNVAKIFSDDYAFSIPNYQRPYAWTTEEASELYYDLLTSIEDKEPSIDNLNPYFLGSIVLIKEENTSDSQVVDGQQRLVTLTILLSSIRSLLDKKCADAISNRIYEKGDSIVGTPDRFRLILRQRDREFFQKYIQIEKGINQLQDLEMELSDSCKNIRDNALFFLKKMEALSVEERVRLASFITRQCCLVVVSTPDLDSAYRIFSVLNDRGRDLSLTDILKADIIGKIGKTYEDVYTEKWEDLEEELGRESFENLFAHIRMISAKKKLRTTVLQEFRNFVAPTKKPKKFIDEVLVPMGVSFDMIANASYEGTSNVDEINKYLVYLRRIDNFDWQPPAILYLTQNRNNSKNILRFLKKLERLAAGMMIIRADINYRLERYGKLISEIENDDEIFGDNSQLQLKPSEQKQIIEALNGAIYSVIKIRLPILLRLDEALSDGEATYNFPIISVEHVLPQTPKEGSKWIEWWPEYEEREENVHRLGNLVLLSRRKNSQARNYDFEKKKEKYFNYGKVCPFALTTQVLNEHEWTPEVVEVRQEQLLETLKNVWDLNMPKRRRRMRT